MKKFKTKSGVIYAPKSEAVEAMMLKSTETSKSTILSCGCW